MKTNHLTKVMQQQRLEAFNAAKVATVKVMVVAMNDEKMGKSKICRVLDRFEELFEEFGNLVSIDVSYGSEKLNDKVDKIMSEKRGRHKCNAQNAE